MARVTDCEVKEILNTEVDTTPFITTANLIVTEELGTSTLSDARLKQIELYLAAHFATLRDPQVKSEKVGDASVTYAVDSKGKGLETTAYGQTALALDTTGTLMNIDKPKAELKCIKTQIVETVPRGY